MGFNMSERKPKKVIIRRILGYPDRKYRMISVGRIIPRNWSWVKITIEKQSERELILRLVPIELREVK